MAEATGLASSVQRNPEMAEKTALIKILESRFIGEGKIMFRTASVEEISLGIDKITGDAFEFVLERRELIESGAREDLIHLLPGSKIVVRYEYGDNGKLGKPKALYLTRAGFVNERISSVPKDEPFYIF